MSTRRGVAMRRPLAPRRQLSPKVAATLGESCPRTGERGPRGAGFTLIEVILSLIILGAAAATLAEIMSLANRGAADARAETQAELLAESVMDELASGYAKMASVTRQPIAATDPETVETDGPWVYSVEVGTSTIIGIVPVEVGVEQDLEPQFTPVKYKLVRWFADITPPAWAATGSSAAGSSSSTSGTAGGAGSGAAGVGGAGNGASFGTGGS